MSNTECTILACPQCQSKRAGIIRSDPPRAKCADCGTTYDIATLPPPPEPKSSKRKRTAAPGIRHRRDHGPAELAVTPVSPPDPQELGTLTRYTQEILEGGPRALIAAQHKAAKLSEKFGEVFEAKWFLLTPWLRQLRLTHRARARYALTWRPRFLATVALSRSVMMGARVARVSPQTIMAHRRADPDFEAQVMAAEEHAIQLLHDVTMKSAIEGECEPIYWQGIPVGHIKKVDNRLRIEMLRAHMPERFKTPGSKVSINTGNQQNNMFICGPKEREELIKLRQEALQRIAAKRADMTALPAGSLTSATALPPDSVA